jgi:hypothetical protein
MDKDTIQVIFMASVFALICILGFGGGKILLRLIGAVVALIAFFGIFYLTIAAIHWAWRAS